MNTNIPNASDIKKLGVSNFTAALLARRLKTTEPTGKAMNYRPEHYQALFFMSVRLAAINLQENISWVRYELAAEKHQHDYDLTDEEIERRWSEKIDREEREHLASAAYGSDDNSVQE